MGRLFAWWNTRAAVGGVGFVLLRLLIGLMVGWYLFAAESLLTFPGDRLVLVQVTFSNAVIFLAGSRTVLYCGGYAPPISVWMQCTC